MSNTRSKGRQPPPPTEPPQPPPPAEPGIPSGEQLPSIDLGDYHHAIMQEIQTAEQRLAQLDTQRAQVLAQLNAARGKLDLLAQIMGRIEALQQGGKEHP